MIINGYDTVVGSKFKRTNNIETTLKTLSTTNRLTQLNPNGVFGVDVENGESFDSFVFPISLTDFRGKKITVFDTRHYANSRGAIINKEEYSVLYAAAVLQQQVYTGNMRNIDSSLRFTTKAFAKATAGFLAQPANLNTTQRVELEIILAHYFICMSSTPSDDIVFVSQNMINSALRYTPVTTNPILTEMGYCGTIADLLEYIKGNDRLGTLSRLDMAGLVGTINRTWYVSSGFKMITGAAAEMPHLFTAICFGSATNNLYAKTAIGRVLDKKETPDITSFVKVISDQLY